METKNTPLFWLGWIIVAVGLWFVLTATVLPSAAVTLLYFSPEYTEEARVNDAGWELLRALSGIIGGVMIGWGLTISHVALNYNVCAQRWLTAAVLSWSILDSIGSVMNSLAYNLILNGVFTMLALLAIYYPNIRKRMEPNTDDPA